MAAGAHALPCLDLGGDAATDAGRDRRALFRAVRRPVSRRRSPRGRFPRRSPLPLERARLLREGEKPAPGHRPHPRPPRGRAAPGCGRAGHPARRGAVHGGRHPRPGPRPAPRDPGRQRQARARPLPPRGRMAGRRPHAAAPLGPRRGPHPGRPGLRLHPGDHGPGRHPLPAPAARLRALPGGGGLRGTVLRGSRPLPPAPGCAATARARDPLSHRPGHRGHGAPRAPAADRRLGEPLGLPRAGRRRAGGALVPAPLRRPAPGASRRGPPSGTPSATSTST